MRADRGVEVPGADVGQDVAYRILRGQRACRRRAESTLYNAVAHTPLHTKLHIIREVKLIRQRPAHGTLVLKRYDTGLCSVQAPKFSNTV